MVRAMVPVTTSWPRWRRRSGGDLAGHCEARGLRQPAFATDVPVEKITDEQARNVLGSVSGRKLRRSAQENAP
jgi:hypothetical protein